MKLKVGDKLIYTYSSAFGTTVYLRKIVKVNKATYKLNTGDLINKDLSPRGKREPFSTTTSKYEVFTNERWREIKKRANENAYRNWVNCLKKGENLNIEFMKRYIEEQEANNDSKI